AEGAAVAVDGVENVAAGCGGVKQGGEVGGGWGKEVHGSGVGWGGAGGGEGECGFMDSRY
ncbi:hypothetical protein NL530_27940, partial [Klebsiella pneumoniae]|nr:hypothetical protein [Klebsiella pneumoniae]